MSASRQERRQLVRSLKALGKAPLSEDEISPFREEISLTAEDVRMAAGRCAACLTTSGERKSCRACSVVRYCNRECQTAGWPSHKLVCRVLAADREISAVAKLTESAPLLALDAIWPRLRGGGHAEAFEAVAHLSVWISRSGFKSEFEVLPTLELERVEALRDEVMAGGGIALLVPGIAAGGLRAAGTARVLNLLSFGRPDTIEAIATAGALPLLCDAVALPSKRVDFETMWTLLSAAHEAVCLLGNMVVSDSHLGPAVVDAGAIPVLVQHLASVLRGGESQPQTPGVRSRWPAPYRDLEDVRLRAARAISCLLKRDEPFVGFHAAAARACVAAGAVPLFLEALGFSSLRVAVSASDALKWIVMHSQDVAVADAVLEASPKLVEIMRRGDADHAAFGAGLLVKRGGGGRGRASPRRGAHRRRRRRGGERQPPPAVH